MKWAIIGLFVAGAAFLLTGWRVSKSGNIDTQLSAVIPTIAGLACWVIMIALLLGRSLFAFLIS